MEMYSNVLYIENGSERVHQFENCAIKTKKISNVDWKIQIGRAISNEYNPTE